jgi:hypothetical protein
MDKSYASGITPLTQAGESFEEQGEIRNKVLLNFSVKKLPEKKQMEYPFYVNTSMQWNRKGNLVFRTVRNRSG